MCTVVCSWSPGEPVRVLALRDELVAREFDDPDEWWPGEPGVVGGRDRSAGGSWCVTDVASGTTALLVNRVERRVGTPSRGGLPLAAVTAGDGWTDLVDHSTMASFTLVLARPAGVEAWTWDATDLHHLDLDAGTHMITSRGVDSDDPKTQRFAPLLTPDRWLDVVASCPPDDAESALVVRHEVEHGVYATVFGQLIDAVPGHLELTYSRTPWVRGSWTARTWTARPSEAQHLS